MPLVAKYYVLSQSGLHWSNWIGRTDSLAKRKTLHSTLVRNKQKEKGNTNMNMNDKCPLWSIHFQGELDQILFLELQPFMTKIP